MEGLSNDKSRKTKTKALGLKIRFLDRVTIGWVLVDKGTLDYWGWIDIWEIGITLEGTDDIFVDEEHISLKITWATNEELVGECWEDTGLIIEGTWTNKSKGNKAWDVFLKRIGKIVWDDLGTKEETYTWEWWAKGK